MLKTLLKKDIAAFLSFFLMGKDGKRRSVGVSIAFALLMVYGFGAMCVMFWEMSKQLCPALIATGNHWVFFAIMGVMASGFGLIGGIFSAKSKLYEAKDNDLLLSMPIPAWALLLTRMISVYAFTLLFEALVFAPAMAQYISVVGASWQAILGGVLVILLMPFGVVAISCLVGFLLTWITQWLPFKNLFIVVGFLAVLVGYYFLVGKINEFLGYVVTNGEAVGGWMQTALFPFAQLGKAATGDFVALLWFSLLFVGVFALLYWLLSVTYFRLITTKKGERYAKYQEKPLQASSPLVALVKKEFLRLFKTPMYLLNASMGSILTLLISVMMLIKGDVFGEMLGLSQGLLAAGEKGLLVVAIVGFMASSNTISASSVSLEGESLWVLQTMPILAKTALFAKALTHFICTVVPLSICAVVSCCVFGVYAYLPWALCMAVLASALFAVMGLALNLKFPVMRWTNETAVVKQSAAATFAMFGGWGVSLLPIGGYFLFGKYLPPMGYLALCLAVYTVALAALCIWLIKRGVKVFKTLQ